MAENHFLAISFQKQNNFLENNLLSIQVYDNTDDVGKDYGDDYGDNNDVLGGSDDDHNNNNHNHNKR